MAEVASAGPVLYLARHASPDLTRTDLVYHLPPGPPLTPIGEIEAAALGAFLRGRGVHRIWASPLERARRTAELAADACSAALVVDDRLIEMQPGESHDEVRVRVWPVWEAAVASAIVDGPAAVIAHGGVATALLMALGVLPADLEAYGRRFDTGNPMPPAGAWEVPVGDLAQAAATRFAFDPRSGAPGSGR